MAKGAHSKADAVYGELKEAILSGTLEPGRLIDKAGLCEKLGVSRFPVSAAVSRLSYDRLVDVAPQHGSFVARISLNDVRERFFIRRALEGEIAAEAARRMTRADKDALAANLKQEAGAVEGEDRAAFYALDVAFHQIMTTCLGMARLQADACARRTRNTPRSWLRSKRAILTQRAKRCGATSMRQARCSNPWRRNSPASFRRR